MDMRKYSGATFIKVADVSEGPLQLQIAVVKVGKYDKPDIVFESGEILSLNATNNRTLIRAYGPNSDDWISKKIELALGQIEYQGEPQDAVIVKPIDAPIDASQKTPVPQETRSKATPKKHNDMDDETPF
jgi:hypothetical protein